MAHIEQKACAGLFVVLLVTTTPARAGTTALDPRDAGARYGQALGAALACPGARVTDKAEALARGFSDTELEAFKRQAALVVALWQKIPHCDSVRNGPNECRLANDVSCQEALREIGPQGQRLPGLIETLR